MALDRAIAAAFSLGGRTRRVMSNRTCMYSRNNFMHSVLYGAGSRRARSAVVPIAFASFSTALRRCSNPESAIAKVKPIISAKSPRIEPSSVEIFCRLREMTCAKQKDRIEAVFLKSVHGHG